ncbi:MULTISPECIES: TerC/Alx family metal homeostasis membrane protein [unclassified Pseudoclavibacter]|uniref:TerC/Alx family metal homeostasis membrane protein n=1 Tax=unclassified Pseudoclavibacter TaxID=2615177 RepID=UPI0013011A7F|nr:MULTISPECIES: TerC/Alx family metal homeostasis membrane protein [unclassified Pseudoclavibacter]KAB1645721.1 TerC/Alx family metal homeostasis membrane protein [Pseudoclavibacter sp. CFCC 14310]KAB1658664.1 TerC/Alx family metal homeostasis membrane protein [Pseudoclavibacter sp. CFCC 11306]KAB1661275.1 TerC/Alx family metal homeostasis membrane protein [Pseudoclavibacter sp. CFCC 13796]KAB1664370.1 TerC/Alx family metal homeostasis membrane protein [Pseudoclavibacter sp. CFCC 13611]
MEPVLPVSFEIGSTIVMLLILVADLLLVVKRPHVPSMKEASLWVGFYVLLALIFAGTLFVIGDAQHGSEFIAGWLTEYSLSIDNLFVFVIIMSRFGVPKKYQQEVLMVGIIVALVLRGVFILLGAQLIESFSFVFYLFGAYLVYTAWKQAFGKENDNEGQEDNLLIRTLRKRVAITDEFDGSKLRTTIDGKRFWTPMVIVFLAIGSTDLLFALDSIPAIFGITQNAFLVFATNVFALMGLRQLYFLLGGLLEKLEYLKYGIAFILAFIGVKLVFHAMHVNELSFVNGGQPITWAPEISTWTSLSVILVSMVTATVASLMKARRDARRSGERGPMPGVRL